MGGYHPVSEYTTRHVKLVTDGSSWSSPEGEVSLTPEPTKHFSGDCPYEEASYDSYDFYITPMRAHFCPERIVESPWGSAFAKFYITTRATTYSEWGRSHWESDGEHDGHCVFDGYSEDIQDVKERETKYSLYKGCWDNDYWERYYCASLGDTAQTLIIGGKYTVGCDYEGCIDIPAYNALEGFEGRGKFYWLHSTCGSTQFWKWKYDYNCVITKVEVDISYARTGDVVIPCSGRSDVILVGSGGNILIDR